MNSSRPLSRRKLLAALGAAGAVMAAGSLPSAVKARGAETLIHNVKEYGALGQGSYGDTDSAGIQSAVHTAAQTGGIVYIPAGRYILTKPVQLKSGIRIMGAGISQTTLTATAGCAFTSLPPASDIEITGLSFHGGSAPGAVASPVEDSIISLLQASHVSITDCRFFTLSSPILLRNCHSCRVDHCDFELILGNIPGKPHYGTGIYCSGGEGHTFFRNTFKSVTNTAVYLDGGCSRSVIQSNDVTYIDQYAFLVQSDQAAEPAARNDIIYNRITNLGAAKSGITAILLKRNVSGCTVSHNEITDLDGDGIRLEGDQESGKLQPADHTLQGNMLKGIKGNGIVISNAVRVSVHGGTFRNLGASGIHIESRGETGSRETAASGNLFSGCKTAGIRISGKKSTGSLLFGNGGTGNGQNVLDEGTGTVKDSF